MGTAQCSPKDRRGVRRRGRSLTVFCGLLDTSLILWGIWTQPHQVKPGEQRQWQLLETLGQTLTPCSPLSTHLPQPHTHQEGITIFMLSVTGIRGLGRDSQKGPPCSGGRRKPQQRAWEWGRAAPGAPSQQAGPVFEELPGNLPRGATGCGWGIS